MKRVMKRNYLKKNNVFYILLIFALGCCSTADTMKSKNNNDEGPLADGCPKAEYTDWKTSNYVLPYPIGQSYLVTLSHCGGSFHSEGAPDEYGVDFAMEIGKTITAARSGVVVYTEEDGIDGDQSHNNIVIIEHSDGTYGQYLHLTQNGALVEVGEEVEQGSEIGLSGNTGLAGFPHLHFIVTKAGSYQYPYTSIPTTFSNTLSNERSLANGYRYPAYEY